MLLKLVIPTFGRAIEGASVAKWYVSEGSRVKEGDDLADLRIDKKTIIKPPPGLKELIVMLTDPGFEERVMQSASHATRPPDEPGSAYTRVKMPERVIRLRAGEAGVLRKIEAPEGKYREVGELLALLTTEENEAFAAEDAALPVTPALRATFIPLRMLQEKGNEHGR